MTMVSFRLDDDDAARLAQWVERLDTDRTSILRTALRRYLRDLQVESDSERWEEQPLTDGESSLGEVADWGPAEDWSDWA